LSLNLLPVVFAAEIEKDVVLAALQRRPLGWGKRQ
jgi:hypothetical protein